jgi:predicted permease
MNALTAYLIAYLFGVATPVLIVRTLLKNSEDGSSCLLDMILWSLASLIAWVVWFELTN